MREHLGLISHNFRAGLCRTTIEMTVESKQAFYEELTSHLGTLEDEEMASVIETVTRHRVTAFNQMCYVMFPEILACIHPDLTTQTCAKLYQGYTIDSKSNPTAVAACFRKQTGKTSSCSGALIPSERIERDGLRPKVGRG